MATIAKVALSSGVPTQITWTTTTGTDTLGTKTGLLLVNNTSGGTANLVIDGASGGTDFVAGYGTVNTSSGFTFSVPAGQVRAMQLDDISKYLRGTVAVSGGGAGILAAII